jgi:hemolysin-activating ACP:hemolysin acyltransferase
MGGVNTNGIDGTVMTSHLSNGHKSVHIPEFQNAASAATQQNRMAWHQAQGTHPVFVCIWDLLKRREKAELKRNFRNQRWLWRF